MMMKNTLSILLVLVVLIFTGCHFGQSETGNNPASNLVTDDLTHLLTDLADGWSTEQDSNGDRAILTTRKMSPLEREKVRTEVSSHGVTWMNSKTGYSLYKISGSERFSKSAFILPKILVIGSVDGGRASVHRLPNGKVALTVPIALIDGSQRELPYATTRIRIPDSLYLDDNKRAVMQKELTDTFGFAHEISSLGACPKSIVIKIAGVENDVTPHVFGGVNGPTGCQPNQPFTVTLTGSRQSIERFLSEDVFNGSAEISALYEVAGTYVDEIRFYQIKTGSLYSRIKDSLFVQPKPADQSDAKITLREITDAEADQLLTPFVQEALSKWNSKERFYDRVKNTALAQMKLVFFDSKISGTASVLVLKDEKNFKPYDVPIRILNESLGRSGEAFYSSSIIKPILNSTNIAVRGEKRQDLSKAPSSGVAQDVFTVHEGEEYELQLTSLLVHEYEFEDEQAQPQIQDKGLVCLDKPGEAMPACRKYLNECTEYKNFCKLPKTGCLNFGTKEECGTQFNFSLAGCGTLGIFGQCSIDRKCGTVTDTGTCLQYGSIGCDEWGSYCSQTQQICAPGQEEPLCKKQISDLRISRYFSAPAPINNHVVNAPLGNTDQDVMGGLTFRFRWPDGKTIDCLALALLKDVVGQSIRFKVKNNAYCKPFPEGYTGAPVLAVVNRVSSERQNIPCGVMNFSTVEGTKYYGCNGYTAAALTPDQYQPGAVSNASSYSRSPLTLSYYPVVDVNGVLISRAGAFTSGETHEDEWSE